MDTQTQIERLIELAIVQRTELRQLVEQLPTLREHLNAEIERTFEETEPQIRTELEEFCRARATDEHAKTGAALAAKVEQLSKQLEITTSAKYAVLMAERAENATLLAQAEARIADAASALPSVVKEIVTDELSRFPRAGEIDQLRKEFAEPRGLNPRGRWMPDETYQRLDLVTINGDSFVSNIDGNRERPSRTAGDWTLSAARGNGGGGGGVTSMTDLVPVPSNGQLLIGNGSAFVNSTLTAGTGISISNGAGSITINATDGNITLDDGTAAAPSLNFTNEPTTGLFRASANVMGFAVNGVSRATMTTTGVTVAGTLGVTGVATLGAGAVLNTPASATLTNATGLPISTGVSGLGTGVAAFLATPSSANLASALTDETGTGALVFATSPTLTTPISASLTSPALSPLTLGTTSFGTALTFTSATGAATFAGAVTASSTAAGGFGQVSVTNNAGAAINNYMLGSTYGGTVFGGVTGNNQAVIEANSTASSLYLGTGTASSIILAPNRTAALTIASTGAATFAGAVTVGGNVVVNNNSSAQSYPVSLQNGALKASVGDYVGINIQTADASPVQLSLAYFTAVSAGSRTWRLGAYDASFGFSRGSIPGGLDLGSDLAVTGAATFAGAVTAASLATAQTAAAATSIVITHKIPITLNGTVYYMALTATP